MPESLKDNRSLVESCRASRSRSMELRSQEDDRVLMEKTRERIRASEDLLARLARRPFE